MTGFNSTNYYNPNDYYSKSKWVRYGSGWTTNEFEDGDNYYKDIIVIAAVICFLGLLSLIIFILAMFFRKYYLACRCLKQPEVIPYTVSRSQSADENTLFNQNGNSSGRQIRVNTQPGIVPEADFTPPLGHEQGLESSSRDSSIQLNQLNTTMHSTTMHSSIAIDEPLDKSTYYNSKKQVPPATNANPGNPAKRPYSLRSTLSNISTASVPVAVDDDLEDGKEDNESDEGSEISIILGSYPWNRWRYANLWFLVIFLIMALAFDQMYLVGMSSAMTGMTDVRDGYNSIQDEINSSFNETIYLVNYGVKFGSSLQNAESTCTTKGYFALVQQAYDNYDNSLGYVNNYYYEIVKELNDYEHNFNGYSNSAPYYSLWMCGVVIIFALGLSTYLQSYPGMKTSIGLGIIILLIFILAGGPLMGLTGVVSDLCVAPTYNVVNQLSNLNNIQDFFAYYSTCSSSRQQMVPVFAQIVNLQQDVAQLNSLLSLNVCPGDKNIQSMRSYAHKMTNAVNLLDRSISCPPIQEHWFQMVNDGICDNYQYGLFLTWGAQLFTTFCLFIALVLASVTYEYIMPIEKLLPKGTQNGSSVDEREFDYWGEEYRNETEEKRRNRLSVQSQYSEASEDIRRTNQDALNQMNRSPLHPVASFDERDMQDFDDTMSVDSDMSYRQRQMRSLLDMTNRREFADDLVVISL